MGAHTQNIIVFCLQNGYYIAYRSEIILYDGVIFNSSEYIDN